VSNETRETLPLGLLVLPNNEIELTNQLQIQAIIAHAHDTRYDMYNNWNWNWAQRPNKSHNRRLPERRPFLSQERKTQLPVYQHTHYVAAK